MPKGFKIFEQQTSPLKILREGEKNSDVRNKEVNWDGEDKKQQWWSL